MVELSYLLSYLLIIIDCVSESIIIGDDVRRLFKEAC